VNRNTSSRFGTLKAAGQRDTVEWIEKVVIPGLRRYARRHGKVEADQKFAHVQGSLKLILEDGLKLGGSHIRISQIFGPNHLKLLVRVERHVSGAVAAVYGGPTTGTYAVNLHRQYTRREIEEAVLAVAVVAEEKRILRRREEQQQERLAGEYPTQTTGTRVEGHHFHDNVLDHPHGDQAGPHTHVERDGDPCWVETHVEERWHTHSRGRRTETEQLEVNRPLDGRQVVIERREGGPREGRAADIRAQKQDGRYRGLLDIIQDLEAALARRISDIERHEIRERELLEENRQLETRLRRYEEAEDPDVAEADQVLEKYSNRGGRGRLT
jgi:hypothetical protein